MANWKVPASTKQKIAHCQANMPLLRFLSCPIRRQSNALSELSQQPPSREYPASISSTLYHCRSLNGSSKMSRFPRSARNARDSFDFDGVFDLQGIDDEDILMQQALLEAVGRVRTPTSPSPGQRSRRASSHPPAYDPAEPNARENAVPYDPTAWGAVSESSSEGRRASSQVRGQAASRYSPTGIAYSPRSRPQQNQQPYDPSSPLYMRSTRLYDPYGPERSPFSVTAGGEPSPGYSPFGGWGRYGYDRSPANIATFQRDVNGVLEALEDYQQQVDSRMDRIEAQFAAISDLLAEQIDAYQADEDRLTSRKKRKRSADKRVSFDTSGDDSDAPSTPTKKPKKSPTPRTPRKQRIADPPKTPRAPRKAASKGPATRTPSTPSKQSKKTSGKGSSTSPPATPAAQVAADVPETPGAPRRSARVRAKTAGENF